MEAKVNTFRLKYHCLPGDCAQAAQFFTASPLAVGDSNGRVDYEYTGYYWHVGASIDGERQSVFQHLHLAGLETIPGQNYAGTTTPGINIPAMRIGGGARTFWMVGSACTTQDNAGCNGGSYLPPGHYIMTGAVTDGWEIRAHDYYETSCAFGGLCKGGPLTPADAYVLDVKIDDGLPLSGRVVATRMTAGHPFYMTTMDALGGRRAASPPAGMTSPTKTTHAPSRCGCRSEGAAPPYSTAIEAH